MFTSPKPNAWQWIASLAGGLAATLLIAQCWLYHAGSRYWWVDRQLQSEAFMNDAIAEAYAFNWHSQSVVLVGSSVTTELPPEGKEIPHEYTIVQEGGDSMTGLEIILRSGAAPRLVLAEADFIDRGINDAVINNVFDPVSLRARQMLLPLRYEYNVINLTTKAYIPRLNLHDRPKESIEEFQKAQLPKLAAQIASMNTSSCIPADVLHAAITHFRTQVEALEKRGSRVVFFFDASIHPAVAATACMRVSRAEFTRMFADHLIIPAPPKDTGIDTYSPDGTHLFASSGLEYFYYLLHAAGADAYIQIPTRP